MYSWFTTSSPSSDEPSIGKKCIPSWCIPVCIACSAPVLAPGRKAGMSPRIGVPQAPSVRTV